MQFTRWGYGKFAIAGILIGMITSAIIAFSIPHWWRSEALLSGPPDPGRWAAILRETPEVVSRRSLVSLIQRRGLYAEDLRRRSLQDVVASMREHIE